MSLTHHFPAAADAVNGWIVKSGFDNNEENSVRLALEMGSKPVTDDNLTAAWKRVQGRSAPADVDASGLSGIPAMALSEALRPKIATAPAGVPRGQLRTALDTFMRVGMPWLYFEGR